MRQCKQCWRFLSSDAEGCPICGSMEPLANVLPSPRDNELSSYKIFAHGVSIENVNYRIIDSIGQGSHGVVLKVVEGGGQFHALKVPLQFNELFTNRQGNKQSVMEMSHKYISHEIKMLGKISSDALIRIIYTGPVRCWRGETKVELPAILMELADGTLKDIIDNRMNDRLIIPYEEKETIIKQLIVDIEQLHAEGLVHRDLSPHNIFVVDRDGEIRYVLADFGASKALAAHENRDSTTKMAFHDRYLDPTLLVYDHLRYDRRIDIYQLGIIITEVLLGEYWQTEDDTFSVSDFRTVDFENDFLLKFAFHEIESTLLKNIRKATTLNIHRRFRSVSEFKKEIHKALDKAGKKRKKTPGNDTFTRNISISFKRILQSEETANNGEKEMPTIRFNGQRRISMDTSEAVKLDFTGLRLTKARIIGPSFLECRKTENALLLRVDSNAIMKKVQPLMRGHKPMNRPFRMELEFKSLLRVAIEGS